MSGGLRLGRRKQAAREFGVGSNPGFDFLNRNRFVDGVGACDIARTEDDAWNSSSGNFTRVTGVSGDLGFFLVEKREGSLDKTTFLGDFECRIDKRRLVEFPANVSDAAFSGDHARLNRRIDLPPRLSGDQSDIHRSMAGFRNDIDSCSATDQAHGAGEDDTTRVKGAGAFDG